MQIVWDEVSGDIIKHEKTLCFTMSDASNEVNTAAAKGNKK